MAEKSERIVARCPLGGPRANMTLYLGKPLLLVKARKSKLLAIISGILPAASLLTG